MNIKNNNKNCSESWSSSRVGRKSETNPRRGGLSHCLKYKYLPLVFLAGLLALPQTALAYQYWGQPETTKRGGSHSPFLSNGEKVQAPMGFLDLCMRSPIDCSTHNGLDNSILATAARKEVVASMSMALGTTSDHAPAAMKSDASLEASPPPEAETDSFATTDSEKAFNPAWSSEAVSELKSSPNARDNVREGAQWASSALNWTAKPSFSNFQSHDGPPKTSEGIEWYSNSINPVKSSEFGQVVIPVTVIANPYHTASESSQSTPSTAENPDAHHHQEPASLDYARIAMTGKTFNILDKINYRINLSIHSVSDAENYAMDDYWVAPGTGPSARGDCEDFALQKRRELISAGIDPNALSLALVRTRAGENHAVLIVASDQGDYVLDNRTDDVKLWNEVPYQWISRQAPGGTLAWVDLSGDNR